VLMDRTASRMLAVSRSSLLLINFSSPPLSHDYLTNVGYQGACFR
jgi:hypothetical protein